MNLYFIVSSDFCLLNTTTLKTLHKIAKALDVDIRMLLNATKEDLADAGKIKQAKDRTNELVVSQKELADQLSISEHAVSRIAPIMRNRH